MSNDSNGSLIAKSGLGAVRALAYENEFDEQRTGVMVTLSKSYYDRRENELKRSSCSLLLPEVSAAIAVLRDIEQQLIARSRDARARPAAVTEESTPDEF